MGAAVFPVSASLKSIKVHFVNGPDLFLMSPAYWVGIKSARPFRSPFATPYSWATSTGGGGKQHMVRAVKFTDDRFPSLL